jgi:tyrosine-specific transport protein
MKKETKFIWAMGFMIIGVSIGAGILGLPLEIGLSGLWPALIGLVLVWALMLGVGWIYMYKFINSKEEISDYAMLYQKELGNWAKLINSIAYLFTFYCLMIAFISGASSTIVGIIPSLGKIPYAVKYIDVIFFIIATSVIIYGTEFMSKFNTVLIIFLFSFFFILLILIFPYFNVSYLSYHKWSHIPFEMPILVTAFGYHIVLPIIYKHSKAKNIPKKGLIKILLLGTVIVLFVNILWAIVVLGVLPVTSPSGISITSAYKAGVPATVPIARLTQNGSIIFFALMFSLIAIITSYIGVGAGVMSYIKDLTGQYFKRRNRATDILITFSLPLVIVLTYPNLFIKMLNIVGGIGIITSFGILPGIMATKQKNPTYIRLLGVLILIFSIFIFAVEFSTFI